MASLADSQFAVVVKRILVDVKDTAVEMPPIGEPGSCIMAQALYYNDGNGKEAMHEEFEYSAHGAPCGNMRHDKVFVIPERLNDFVTDNPNEVPFPVESYIAVPLFAQEKCIGHFGVMYNKDGNARRKLSWGFLEMFLHSLEDMILDRLVTGRTFTAPERKEEAESSMPAKVIPHEAVSAAQSLKPYARSLSHELRTPMQGVVGMLDVMHATVQEAVSDHPSRRVRDIFQTLRENIEVVQDSSRRAVEAADNVVHAYDLNMEVPDTPVQQTDDVDSSQINSTSFQSGESRPNILIEGHSLSINPANKKRRRSLSIEWNIGPDAKHRIVDHQRDPHQSSPSCLSSCRFKVDDVDVDVDVGRVSPKTLVDRHDARPTSDDPATPAGLDPDPSSTYGDVVVTPGVKHSRLREVLRETINESLRSGGRPDSAIAVDTSQGERIEVRSRNSRGEASTKVIEWSVDASVPETILVDERDLAKLISCVFVNSVKFTESGRITVTALMSPKSRYIVINVQDTGPGIPKNFLPCLFKPFSREDDSTTRQKEGLGLGLLVAKGLARKIGGDIVCLRSDTTGPMRGTDFEIRVPVSPADASSMPGTPSNRTPTPSASNQRPSIAGHDSFRSRIGASSPDGHHPENGRPTPRSIAPARSKSPVASNVRHPVVERNSPSRCNSATHRRPTQKPAFNRRLAETYPLTILVAEDNKINRRLLVNMLSKLGYKDVYEAYDGAEAVRQMNHDRERKIDVVLMDLWMPSMDGYEATRRILSMPKYTNEDGSKSVGVLAVTADVTAGALEKAALVGMKGLLTKPYKLHDLERLIVEYCMETRPLARAH
ncbi:MAG: hypothetical protein M1825_004755 [Sarcosagium campestre]|nr:MAG: hypothetical protein M1825_004755 [Sarcosagium campestre]